VYDVCNRPSFDHLENWVIEADTYCTKNDVVKMLVANKVDAVGIFQNVQLLKINLHILA
jgi:GTPase SAR1 family protein